MNNYAVLVIYVGHINDKDLYEIRRVETLHDQPATLDNLVVDTAFIYGAHLILSSDGRTLKSRETSITH